MPKSSMLFIYCYCLLLILLLSVMFFYIELDHGQKSIKIEHEPDIFKNCSIDITAPCDADCVIVYSTILLPPSELVPAIFGRDNKTINGPVLLEDGAIVGSVAT